MKIKKLEDKEKVTEQVLDFLSVKSKKYGKGLEVYEKNKRVKTGRQHKQKGLKRIYINESHENKKASKLLMPPNYNITIQRLS